MRFENPVELMKKLSKVLETVEYLHYDDKEEFLHIWENHLVEFLWKSIVPNRVTYGPIFLQGIVIPKRINPDMPKYEYFLVMDQEDVIRLRYNINNNKMDYKRFHKDHDDAVIALTDAGYYNK